MMVDDPQSMRLRIVHIQAEASHRQQCRRAAAASTAGLATLACRQGPVLLARRVWRR